MSFDSYVLRSEKGNKQKEEQKHSEAVAMSPPRYSSKAPKVIKQVSFGREPVEKKNEANIR
jgi:hypothetical protein